MKKVWFALGLTAVLACIPQRHPVAGRPCDDAHPCPDALDCVDLVCLEAAPRDAGGGAGASGGGASGGGAGGSGGGGVTDAGPEPTNLLPAGDFEGSMLSTLAVFRATGGEPLELQQARVHGGATAARLVSRSAELVLEAQSLGTSSWPAGTYCATAWVSGDGGSATLSLRATLAGNPTPIVSTPLAGSTQSLAQDWRRVVASLTLASAPFIFQLRLSAMVPNGSALFVDDVVLWRSTSGTCGFE